MLADPPVEIVRGYTGDSFDKPLRGGRNLGFFWGATDEAKVMIMQDLAKGFLTIDPGCPSDTENQLVSEKLIRTETQHRVRRKWVPIQGQAERSAGLHWLCLHGRPGLRPNRTRLTRHSHRTREG